MIWLVDNPAHDTKLGDGAAGTEELLVDFAEVAMLFVAYRLKFKERSQNCYIRSIMLKYLFPLSFVYILTKSRTKIFGAWLFQRTFQIFPTTSVGLANSF